MGGLEEYPNPTPHMLRLRRVIETTERDAATLRSRLATWYLEISSPLFTEGVDPTRLDLSAGGDVARSPSTQTLRAFLPIARPYLISCSTFWAQIMCPWTNRADDERATHA